MSEPEPSVLEYPGTIPQGGARIRLYAHWFDVRWHDSERRWVGRGAKDFERANQSTLSWPERVVIVRMVGCDVDADRHAALRFELPDGREIVSVAYIPPITPRATDGHVRARGAGTACVYGFILGDRKS